MIQTHTNAVVFAPFESAVNVPNPQIIIKTKAIIKSTSRQPDISEAGFLTPFFELFIMYNAPSSVASAVSAEATA